MYNAILLTERIAKLTLTVKLENERSTSDFSVPGHSY